jgi:predicted transcriptional regulator of viral defense system
MKFSDFLQIYSRMPLIDAESFPLYSDKPEQLRSQVSHWVEKGWLKPLKRGLYVFSETYRPGDVPILYLANSLNKPSYVSMEHALGFYDLIPEKIVMMTSVTTKKTQSYKNEYGTFKYYSIKKDFFLGYNTHEDGEQKVFIASPEKALLDYFYFNQPKFNGHQEEFEAMRFQNLDQLNHESLNSYKNMYGPKMHRIIEGFIIYMQDIKQNYKRL